MLNHSPLRQASDSRSTISLNCTGFNQFRLPCTIATLDCSIKARGEILSGQVANGDCAEFGALKTETLNRRPHLLWRGFKLATIDHLQKLKRPDPFWQSRHALLRFNLIQNRYYPL